MAEQKKILCIFSNLLGVRTISEQYQHALDEIEGLKVRYLFINPDDYKKYSVPFWARWSNTLEIVYIARKKFQQEINNTDFDLILINGFEMALAFSKFIQRTPSILIADTTPVLAQGLIRQESPSFFKMIRSKIRGGLASAWCRVVFAHIKHFLPVSNWCADSFIQDYSVDPKKISVLYSPLDIDLWKNSGKREYEQVRILFVGNDFRRKGGPFLFELFKKCFQKECILTIISNDDYFRYHQVPNSVEVFADIDHKKIHEIFTKSDIFVFPTWRDQMGLVVGEAMASSLPVVARDVGGISDVVQDGYNGYLMPYDSTQEEWAKKIQYLIDHSEERECMGQNGRKIAEQKFDINKFNMKIKDIVSAVIKN